MRKFSLIAALILIASVLAGCSDSAPNNDTVPVETAYTGPILDLVAEAERNTPPEEGTLQITKVDKETGWCVVTSIRAGDKEVLYPCMDYKGERYQLRFEDGILTGYMTISSAEDTVCSLAEGGVYSTDKLEELLGEYTRQVDELIEARESEA